MEAPDHSTTGLRSASTLYRVVLFGFALLVLGLLFRELVTLLLAVLITVIMAIPLAAFATRLERHGVPRALGALVGLLAAAALLGGVLMLVIPPFVQETEAFVDDVPGIVDDLSESVRRVVEAEPGEVGAEVQEFLRRYTDDPMRLIRPLTSIGLGVVGVLAGLVLIVMTAYFIAVRPDPLVEGALRLFPPARRPWALSVMARLRSAWMGWLGGVGVDMLVTGVLLYAGLVAIGLDFAIVFTVISALLVVVPYFGAILGGIPPVLFALADSPGKALLALGVYVLVQQIEGNVIIPLVMARAVRLHPALIAVGVVVVGQLFGVVGLFVSVPLISTVVILVEEVWVRPLEEAAARDLALPVEVERR